MSGALAEGTTLAFLGLCAAGQRPACDGELDGAVRWRVRGGERDDLFSAMVSCDKLVQQNPLMKGEIEGKLAAADTL